MRPGGCPQSVRGLTERRQGQGKRGAGGAAPEVGAVSLPRVDDVEASLAEGSQHAPAGRALPGEGHGSSVLKVWCRGQCAGALLSGCRWHGPHAVPGQAGTAWQAGAGVVPGALDGLDGRCQSRNIVAHPVHIAALQGRVGKNDDEAQHSL